MNSAAKKNATGKEDITLSDDAEEQTTEAKTEEKSDISGDQGQEKWEDDERRMKRVMANRNSARASYQRRKRMVAELQSEASDLNQMNQALMAENKKLRLEVQELRHQANLLLLSRNPTAGGLNNLGSPNLQSANMFGGGLGGLSDLGVAAQGAHPLQLGSSSSLFSNAMSGAHPHSFPTNNLPTLNQAVAQANLNQPGGVQQQNQQDETTLELQRAFLTKQFLARSLGLPPGGR